ncbi:DNA-directed RNA polymerase subunit alpha [Candidatus Beckwithbacteria bacterium]|nr:DNA-directed RNA polymerase subunit alpha [Candidatus Beckwithbacteria bacterium]
MNNLQFLIKPIEEKRDYAKLVIEPLEQGYGHTIGNALRRVMLSSLKGAGISQVKIDGVGHKFTTLKGMKEDVVDFILNLKQVKVKYDGDEPVDLYLDFKGKGEVKASDIEVPSGVEIINPELVLANLADDKSKLKAVITVESGFGYILAEERKVNTIGVIPVDTSFSPVSRVKVDVLQTRVGRRTDFDKLILELWTDGTVNPIDAVRQASEILIAYFKQIVEPVVPEEKIIEEVDPKEKEIMRLTVEELDLPTRIANALRKGGYENVRDLSKASRDDIAKVKNLGGKSVDIVIEKLAEKGVNLTR